MFYSVLDVARTNDLDMCIHEVMNLLFIFLSSFY
jgi:hypothetical protein